MTAQAIKQTSREVANTAQGMPTSDGAGVKLTRLMGTPQLQGLDPFLLLDEFRSDNGDDYIAGFPDHPHRGFETVTYMLDGRMRHGDNKGNSGLLKPGSVQWMTAGRGIVHSEMPEQEEGLMHGFQLWVNLPAKDKMTAPRYQDIQPDAIPVVEPADGVRVKVMAGEVAGTAGAVTAVATEPVYLDVRLAAGAQYTLDLPVGHNAFVYVFEGTAAVGAAAQTVAQGTLAVLDRHGDSVTLSAPDGAASVLVAAGRPLNEPVAHYGPFVMNTKEELMQAMTDYQAGRF